MAGKTNNGKLDVTAAVKAAARAKIGAVPPTRAVPDAKKRQQLREAKHKPTLATLLKEEH